MKLLKPSWVNHDDHPIFSIDVHPDNSRFVTGGQGQDSGKIIIWNMGPVIDRQKEMDENTPRILCQMDHHIACVNVVRWSNNGSFLASGSDDKLIMIWHYVQGMGNFQNIENWKCGHTLRGHSGDVLDLAWSTNDEYLATCSVDNTIIIWNALKFPDIISRINAHAGLVKGVTWDPVGAYLASQSDDKTLKIWKTLDWTNEKCIEEPFKQCTGTTHVLRLGWSPDGQIIISAHAINNGAPTAQVIDRGNKWNTKLDFVGHRKAVTSVRFFPRILKQTESSEQNVKTHCLCALGSRDRSISIWLTHYQRSLCVIQDIFDNPIMDLSWSRNSKPGLLACSMDGSVAYLEFDNKDVGYPLNKQETENFFMKKYNHDINLTKNINSLKLSDTNQNFQNQKNKDSDENVKLIENFDILIAQEQEKDKYKNVNLENKPVDSQTRSIENVQKLNVLNENSKQIERRMPDGRRRITPICVSKPGEYDQPKPFGSNISSIDIDEKLGFSSSIGFGSPPSTASQQNELKSKTATEKSTIIIEKRDEKDEILEISPVKSISYTKSDLNNDLRSELKSNTQKDNLPIPSLVGSNSNNNIINKPISTDPSNLDHSNRPIHQSSNLKTNEQNKSNITIATINKPKIVQPCQPNNSSKVSNIANDKEILLGHNETVKEIKNTHLNNVRNDAFFTPSNKTNVLQALNVGKNPTSKIGKDDDLIVIENSISISNNKQFNQPKAISNTDRASDNLKINFLKYFQKNTLNKQELKWKCYFYEEICDVVFNKSLIACVCQDSTLHFIKTKNGSQICSPIVLDSKAAILSISNNNTTSYIMFISTRGFIYVWKYCLDTTIQNDSLDQNNKNNYEKQSNSFILHTLINQQSIQFILEDRIICDSFITDNGVPVIQMSGNRSYYYSLESKCWHLVPSKGSLFGETSFKIIANSNSVFAENKSVGKHFNNRPNPLEQIQSKNKNTDLLKSIEIISQTGELNDSIIKNDLTLAHLESQLNATIGLNSPKEYKFWLFTLIRYLVENNYEERLTDLCDFLIGPMYSIYWEEHVMTFKKRDLLKEILPVIAQNLKLQRLYIMYKQQLSLIDNIDKSNSKLKSSVFTRILGSENRDIVNKVNSNNSQEIFGKNATNFAVENGSNKNSDEMKMDQLPSVVEME